MSLKHIEIFERLISNTYIGVAVHKMIFDNKGNPLDYQVIDVNPAFEKITGLKKVEIAGKTIRQAVPDIEEEWIENYGKIVKSGIESHFELYSKPIKKCLKVHAYSYDENKFVSLIIDSTDDYLLKEYLMEEVVRNHIAVKSAKIAFFKYDLSIKKQSVSEYWYELVGVKNEIKNIQTYFLSHIHPDDRKAVIRQYEKLEHIGELQCEFRFYHSKDEKYIWIRKTAVLASFKDDKNEKIAIGIYQDIDQEKHSQEEIEKLAQMLDLGIKTGGIDVWDYDIPADNITFRSNDSELDISGEKIYQFSLAEHISKINKADVGGFLQELNLIQFHGQKTFDIQYRVFSERKKREIWMKSTGRVIEYDEEGNIRRAVGICQDISLRVEYEQKIITNQKRLKQAQKIALLGGWEYYFEDDKFVLSEEALQLLDFNDNKNEFTIRELAKVLGDVQKAKLRKFRIGISRADQYEEEFYMYFDSGIKKIHVIATKNYDLKGKMINIIGTFQDITERNALEERLRQAEKMTAVGQLAGGIAHDFNNILMSASGYTELIKYKTDDPIIQEYCNKILNAIRSSAELTKKLLAFSRKDSLFKDNLHLHKCICKAIEILSITIDKSIYFDLNFLADRDFVYADETEMQNVCMNLCLNSRDAMPEGGVISITTYNIYFEKEKHIKEFTLSQGEYICIKVSDTGQGIGGDIIKNIFEPFFTTKEIGKGTGLGLSAIYGTVVSHDGAITVDSIVGKGTDFFIYLPLSKTPYVETKDNLT